MKFWMIGIIGAGTMGSGILAEGKQLNDVYYSYSL